MGPPQMTGRLAQLLIGLVALFALANGLFMLIDPLAWYGAVPTVRFTGPPNRHFIRDIGLAYIASGAVLAYAARFPYGRWLAAVAGNLWLTVHGVLHIYEVAVGICSPSVFWTDAPGVLGPPLLVWIALGILFAGQRIAPAGLPASLFIAAAGRISPEETPYLRRIREAPGHAFEKFLHLMPATMHRHEAPASLFHMARIGAALVEDCGPCAVTAAKGALADGVAKDEINAALAGEPLEGDARLAFDFGRAIARHSADADSLGAEVQRRCGAAVRFELAMTAAAVRIYPAMKRGLGLGESCAVTRPRI